MLGKLRPEVFPHVFGSDQNAPLDVASVARKFADLAAEIEVATGDKRTPVEVADGFLRIAVENMANAIKKISVQRGYDVTTYTLNCFGGAGGQHACLVADALGMTKILIHPFAGVLSAYGWGSPDIRALRERAVEATLDDALMPILVRTLDELGGGGRDRIARAGYPRLEDRGDPPAPHPLRRQRHAGMPSNSDHAGDDGAFRGGSSSALRFHHAGKGADHRGGGGRGVGIMAQMDERVHTETAESDQAPRIAVVEAHMAGREQNMPVIDRDALLCGHKVPGPAIIREQTATTIVEPGWQAEVTPKGHLVVTRVVAALRNFSSATDCDPVMLEVFNNLFMSIAEQMGVTLQNTAYSVNIKNGWISPAPFSIRTACLWPMRRIFQSISDRWASRSGPFCMKTALPWRLVMSM